MWWQQPTHRPLICYLRWTIRWPGTWRLCRCNSWSGGSSPSRWRPAPRRSRCTSSRFRTRCRSTGQWWTWWRGNQSLRPNFLSVLNDSAWLQHIFHTGFTIPVWFNFNYRLHSNINQFSTSRARFEQIFGWTTPCLWLLKNPKVSSIYRNITLSTRSLM